MRPPLSVLRRRMPPSPPRGGIGGGLRARSGARRLDPEVPGRANPPLGYSFARGMAMPEPAEGGAVEPAAALRGFADLLRRGSHREASELLEEAWRRERDDLAKALIKMAVALYQWRRGRRRGARRLLEGAVALLEERFAAGGWCGLPAGSPGRPAAMAAGSRWPRPNPGEGERLGAAVRGCLAAVRQGREPPAALVEEVARLAAELGGGAPSGPALR